MKVISQGAFQGFLQISMIIRKSGTTHPGAPEFAVLAVVLQVMGRLRLFTDLYTGGQITQ